MRASAALPLIPTKAWTGDLSFTASRKHGIGLPATVEVSTLTGVGGACPICRSDRTGL